MTSRRLKSLVRLAASRVEMQQIRLLLAIKRTDDILSEIQHAQREMSKDNEISTGADLWICQRGKEALARKLSLFQMELSEASLAVEQERNSLVESLKSRDIFDTLRAKCDSAERAHETKREAQEIGEIMSALRFRR